MTKEMEIEEKLAGILVGTAVGDALGLPAEGMSRHRISRIFSDGWRHRFVLNRGMISDDTEHTIFVAQSILACPNSPSQFGRRLGRCFRWWLLALAAGIGLGTLRAIIKLWLGFPPTKSGVFSAGNGPAMRSAVIGGFYAHSQRTIDEYVKVSTEITHTDPRALIGAKAVARAASWCILNRQSITPSVEELELIMRSSVREDVEWNDVVDVVIDSANRRDSVNRLAEKLGLSSGVTGYIYHTVPICIYAWFHHFGDFRATVESVLGCGGDTDTLGAITGALAGASVGVSRIPGEWVDGIADWPRGIPLLMELATRLAQLQKGAGSIRPVKYFWPAVIFRNVFFLLVVLTHGFRRLAPPY